MSGRVKIKIKDKKPKIDVFKVIENRFKNMNEPSGSDRHGSKERAGQDPGRGRLQRGGAGRVPAPELP